MNKNNLIKIGFCLVIGVIMFSFFKFRTMDTGDVRMNVYAAYFCDPDLLLPANCPCGCIADPYGGKCRTCPTATPTSGTLRCYCADNNCGSGECDWRTSSSSTYNKLCANSYCSSPTATKPPPTATKPPATKPPATVTITPPPGATPGVCMDDGSDGNNICLNPPAPICGYECHPEKCYTSEWTGTAIPKTTSCYSPYCKSTLLCYIGTTLISAPTQCGYCGTGVLTPTGCQIFTCFNNTTCGISPAWTDNCGGTGCGYCPGTGPTAVPPTSPPGGPTSPPPTSCVPIDCSLTPCTSTTCNDTTCKGNCDQICWGKKLCSTPTALSLKMYNFSGTIVYPGTTKRNHICQPLFVDDPNPKSVTFVATVSDADGYYDISTVRLRWNGTTKAMTYVPLSGSGETADWSVVVDYTGVNNSGTYPLEVKVVDKEGNVSFDPLVADGYVGMDRSWKVWNCLVSVSGSLYDGSSGLACNTAYQNLVDIDFNFKSLTFKDTVSTNDVITTVSSVNSFGINSLIWNGKYAPYFNGGDAANPNGDLAGGSGRLTRITSLGTGVSSCPLVNQYNIQIGSTYLDPYEPNPLSIKMDFSFIRNQEGWYEVVGGGVKGKDRVNSAVPATALNVALSMSGTNATNGLVSFTNSTNTNGNNTDVYGMPNNWWINKSTNDSTIYNSLYFYNKLFVTGGVGATLTSSFSSIPSSGGIYFFNGDLNIDKDFTLDAGKYLLIIAKGKIKIEEWVTALDGIFVADNGIEASGTNVSQLGINGMLYSRSDISLTRSFVDKSINNDTPAIVVYYKPSLIFNMPGKLMRVLSGWQEE